MDRHEHDLVVAHALDDLDDVLAVLAAQPAGGFVEQVDVGPADHVQPDVEPLALAAAERLLHRAADDGVAALVEAEFDELAVDAPGAFAAGEVRRTQRRREGQVFLDGQLFVEGVVLRDVGDVAAQFVEVVVEGAAVEDDLAAVGPVLPGDGAQERALAAAARAHDADHLAARGGEGDVVHGLLAVAEGMPQVAHLQHADDVALLLDDALGEIAPQHLAHVDADHVAVGQPRGVRTGTSPTMIARLAWSTSRLADLLVVVAGNLQQHVAARAGERRMSSASSGWGCWKRGTRSCWRGVGTGRRARGRGGAGR